MGVGAIMQRLTALLPNVEARALCHSHQAHVHCEAYDDL